MLYHDYFFVIRDYFLIIFETGLNLVTVICKKKRLEE